MNSTYFIYPLILGIIISIIMYIFTHPLNSSTKYLEITGISYLISWIFFICLSGILIKFNIHDK